MADRVEIAGQSPAWVFRAIEEAHRQALEKVKRERDAAVARAEAAEKRHQWPKTTPTEHTYTAPDTYAALCHQHGNAAQAAIESWDADECPPEPTWEMVGIARREVERRAATIATLQGDFLRVERERDEWKARTTPAVTKADIEKAVAEWVDDAPEVVNEVWSLVSGADPAVHVVRESDIAAPAVTRDDIDRALINVTSNAMNYPTPAQILGKDTEPLRRKCVDAICDLLCIEADQGVDPMEAGQALWEAVWGHKHPPSAWFEIGQGLREEYALIETHIARQEASDE